MSSVWNLLNPIRNGGTNLKLLSGGREFFGTVIKHGKMDKTVTVKIKNVYIIKNRLKTYIFLIYTKLS